MSFKLRSLKNMNVCSCTSPDSFVEMYKSVPAEFDNMIARVTQEKIKFQQWKRVKLPNGKERMRIVDVELQREEYVQVIKKQFAEFVEHVSRVTQQYRSVKAMKDNLPKNHVLVQMDFSENYNCQTVEEIQSAYWNASMVTLHPTIIYFNRNNESLNHKSLIFVSEVLNHNASMVSAIITKTVQTIRTLDPDLNTIHFWTDSPSSQYRNKSIFDILSNFENSHGCQATWHYFEAGHGKSACDGVGGTAKRNADMAVKLSKAVIQDANDFFAWAVSNQSEIEYQMITPDEYQQSNEEIERRKQEIKPVKGTMSVHAVTTGQNGILYLRNTTCTCRNCFSDDGFNPQSQCKWERVKMQRVEHDTNMSTTVTESEPCDREKDKTIVQVEEADFIVAEYDGICYIGQVLEIDRTDKSQHVNFMAESGKSLKRFKWPQKADKIWIEEEKILRKIEPPMKTGKGGRIFAVPDEIIRFMEEYKQ